MQSRNANLTIEAKNANIITHSDNAKIISQQKNEGILWPSGLSAIDGVRRRQLGIALVARFLWCSAGPHWDDPQVVLGQLPLLCESFP
jgi:hypothetical protein